MYCMPKKNTPHKQYFQTVIVEDRARESEAIIIDVMFTSDIRIILMNVMIDIRYIASEVRQRWFQVSRR